jgi:prevent-host-death family protein
MRKASISEAKNGLSALLDRVRAGESILILDRGTPVARLEPVTTGDARLARLVRAGLVRPPRRPGSPSALLAERPPGPRGGTGAVEALLAERRAGR